MLCAKTRGLHKKYRQSFLSSIEALYVDYHLVQLIYSVFLNKGFQNTDLVHAIVSFGIFVYLSKAKEKVLSTLISQRVRVLKLTSFTKSPDNAV